MYISGGDKITMAYIDFAGSLSLRICEKCGSTKDVSQPPGSWIRTRCQRCFDAELNENLKNFMPNTPEGKKLRLLGVFKSEKKEVKLAYDYLPGSPAPEKATTLPKALSKTFGRVSVSWFDSKDYSVDDLNPSLVFVRKPKGTALGILRDIKGNPSMTDAESLESFLEKNHP